MNYHRLVFRKHALQRMFERNIRVEDVEAALETGRTIAEYPDDKPYPSRLILGKSTDRQLHVVVAENIQQREGIVVTVYEPDSTQWEEGLERRKTR